MPPDNQKLQFTPIETWIQNPRVVGTRRQTLTTPASAAQGNQTLTPAQQAAPQPVQGVSVVRTPVVVGGASMVKHTLTFKTTPNDQSFDKVLVHLKGYLGNPNPVQVAGGTAPLSFVMPATGENISILVQPVGKSGQPLALSMATSTASTL